MSGIQSSVGLISGIDIGGTVKQLMDIAGRPRARLAVRAQNFATQQTAITDLTKLVVSLELSAKRLSGENSIFKSVKVNSSSESVTAVKNGTPAVGSFNLTPIRRAETNQLLSSSVASLTTPIGAGTLSFQKGGLFNQSLDLDHLNGGTGVERGQIRITDRSGATAVIDLRQVKTVEDVVEAINSNSDISVEIRANGDGFELVDQTGQTTANLRVQEVGGGSTAFDLGLSGINVAASSANGADIVSLSDDTLLSSLNNGNGVAFKSGNAAISISLADGGANVDVNFGTSTTLGQVVDLINAAAPTRVQAQISASGDRLEILDLTSGSGTFTVNNGIGSTAATDLGINGNGSGGTLNGKKIQAGLDTVLLSRLGGGQGLGTLGVLSITDRNGGSANVNLSTATTLDDVLNAINNAVGISVQAVLNENKTGFEIRDESGGSGTLTIANGGDGLQTATKLRIAQATTSNAAKSQALDLQSVNRNTKLSDFRNGITNGSFLIKNSQGVSAAVNLSVLGASTIGDVLDAVNSLGIGVQASINDEGNGIRLVDTAGGTGTFTINDVGNGQAAAQLGIAGTGTDQNGSLTLEGSQRTSIDVTATDTLDNLITKINASGANVRASRFFDGVGYRLNLTSQQAGQKGNVWLDTSLNLGFSQVTRGRDALVQFGPPDSSAALLLSSSSNTFTGLVPNVDFTVNQSSQTPVTISVETDQDAIANAVQLFVDQFNGVANKVKELTSFESNTTASGVQIKTGVLFGTSEALRVEQDLNRLASATFTGAGTIRSLREVGIEFDAETRTLTLDKTKFNQVLEQNPSAVVQFFESENTGVAARFTAVTDRLAGVDNSVLLNRNTTLQRQIETINDRIDAQTQRLEAYQNRLLNQFYRMEETLSRMQRSQTAVNSIQSLPST
ncbi:MAG: flagellar filament capping protein FliD [Planctomycetaceae bacterium]|jgi:flagellar hook-associated protein 2|nr:flagellar filament capping protein FliD [Planctomycetaceae bacterium]